MKFMTKYKQAYEEMVAKYHKEFEEFKIIHDKFVNDNDKYKAEFDKVGKPLLRIIEEKENWLCSKMEGAGRGSYSSALADKFKMEVKKYLPMIDLVGVEIC